ncbi:MAG: IS200/IS605 family element transposase accessory protein TnpB, partial [Endozoicomonadaceae bacterium]|nr:IS200/IS605 family element transposase accessory protein TnpB [Endozoicomonadaceae bacterium]
KKAEAKIRKLSRSLSRKVKGGKNRAKVKLRLTKIHEKVANRRNHQNHVMTSRLVNQYDYIAVEKLATSNMMKNHNLAGAIQDASWHDITHKLSYKAEKAGKIVQFVNPRNTSQMCSACGSMPEVKKTLGIRTHKCEDCGYTADRDINASINILNKGLDSSLLPLSTINRLRLGNEMTARS